VRAYRIGTAAHPLLDGAGAAASDDARWNTRGRHIIYAAEHYATALLEKAAQLNSVRIPRTLVYIRIEIPDADGIVEEVQANELRDWDSPEKAASQRFGDRWYDERRSLVLLVPSLAAPGLERNVLINQRHPAFGRVAASRPDSIRCHPRLLI
jgi:RES domain-containing protein